MADAVIGLVRRQGFVTVVKPAGIEIVRRAYELWEQAGKPEGRDQEFYLQAERELSDAASSQPDHEDRKD